MLFLLRKAFRRKGSTYKLSDMLARLFYTKLGQVFISALFGLAIAFMFQKVCKDRKCIVIEAPPMNLIEDKIFDTGDGCYTYTPKVSACTEDAVEEK